VAAKHDGFSWLVIVKDEDGLYVCHGHVASVAGCVHNFIKVVDRELCRVCFDGWEAVAEFGDGAVKSCTGEVAY
jgi:hypothetical protein